MPNYKTHLTGGALAFSCALVAIVPYCQPTTITAMEWFFFTLAGSLFPDIDIKSRGQKYFYWFVFILLILLSITKKFMALSVLSILAITPLLGKHRGLFHRAWFLIIAPLAICYVFVLQYPHLKIPLLLDISFFIVGALSHVWLDVGLKKMFRF